MTLQQPRPIISSIINRIHEVKDSLMRVLFAFPQIWKGFTFGQKNPMKTDSAKPGAFLAVSRDGRAITWGSLRHGAVAGGWLPPLLAPPRQVAATRNAFAVLQEDGAVVWWGRGSSRTLNFGRNFFVWSDFLFDILFFVSFFFWDWHYVLVYMIITIYDSIVIIF